MDSLEAFARAHAQNADHAQEMIQRGIALIGLNARKEIVEFRSGSGYHVYADTIVGWARNRNRFFDALSHMEKIIGSAAADQRSADRSSLATIQKHIDVLEVKGKANSREDIDAGIKTLADLEDFPGIGIFH